MEYLAQHIESLIFTCEQPISFNEIKAALEETFETTLQEEDLQNSIKDLMERYQSNDHAFEIIKIAGGYQFLTKGAFHNTVGTFLKQSIKKRLSRAALETLAIIAYKQPVTKTDIENIRGVNCDYAVQKLLEKELISIIGRKEAPGRPLLYGSSQKFMDYFGIEDIKDLPKLKEFTGTENSIGEAAPIEENTSSEDSRPRREDDVVDVAIAVANIYDPLPINEEEDPGDTPAPDDGAPSPDPNEAQVEEGTVAPTEEAPETHEPEAEVDTEETPSIDEPEAAGDIEHMPEAEVDSADAPNAQVDSEGAIETQVEAENLPEATTEETEAGNSEGIAEFVQETAGEFAGQTSEEILQENDLNIVSENIQGPDDVNS